MTECLRCEKDFSPKQLIHAEGCSLCQECYEHIQVSYALEMRKEEGYVQQTLKCKGCD
jgi:NAD-dependent dihydropyrimidine dehydrogenase PreA subunit